MTTFVLCNECGNRWKVCMSVSFFLPCHPQELPHLRSSRPTAPNGGWQGAVLPACTEQVCRAGDSGALLGRQGQRTRVCVFSFWKAPSQGGDSSRHFITGWASLSFEHRWNQPPEIPGVAGSGGWEGKTIALCTWTTPLCKVLPQMLFPLSPVTAREVGTTEPCQTGTALKCTQVILPS